MKKYMIVLLTLVLITGTGCGNNENAGNKTGDAKEMLHDTVLAKPTPKIEPGNRPANDSTPKVQ